MAGRPIYQQVHTDIPLTNMSVAYVNASFIADQIFPNVPVQNLSGKYFIYQKGDWLRREALPRAPGTRAVRGDYGLSASTYFCVEIAFAKGVPEEIVENSDAPLKPYEDAALFVTNNILLQKESDTASIAFGTGWASSATPSPTWDNDTSDPLGDVETGMNSIASNIGREANKGVIGRAAWAKLRNHPDIVDRIKYSAGPTAPAVVTVTAVAALFGLDNLLVGTAVENTAPAPGTETMSYIWGKHLLLGSVTNAPSLLTPSAGYTFVYRNREITRFPELQERQEVIEGRWSYKAAQVAQDAGYLVKNVVP